MERGLGRFEPGGASVVDKERLVDMVAAGPSMAVLPNKLLNRPLGSGVGVGVGVCSTIAEADVGLSASSVPVVYEDLMVSVSSLGLLKTLSLKFLIGLTVESIVFAAKFALVKSLSCMGADGYTRD